MKPNGEFIIAREGGPVAGKKGHVWAREGVAGLADDNVSVRERHGLLEAVMPIYVSIWDAHPGQRGDNRLAFQQHPPDPEAT